MGFWNVLGDIGRGALSLLGGTGIPIIGGAASALSNWIESEMSEDDAKEQHQDDLDWQHDEAQINRDFQTSEREAAQKFDLDMWNLNNEYNSPEQQVERLIAAGINPASAFGSGNSVATSSPVTTSPMSGSMAGTPNGFASSLLTSSAIVRNLDAQSSLLNQQEKNAEYDLTYNKLTQEDRIKLLKENFNNMKADTGNKEVDSYLKSVDATVKEQNAYWYGQKTDNEIQLMKKQLDIQSVQYQKELYYYSHLQPLERQRLNAEINDINKSAALKEKQSLSTQQSIYESQHKIIQIDQETDYTAQLSENEQLRQSLLESQKAYSVATGLPLGTQQFEMNYYLYSTGQMWNYYNKAAMEGIDEVFRAPGKALGGFQFGKNYHQSPSITYKYVKRPPVGNPPPVQYF